MAALHYYFFLATSINSSSPPRTTLTLLPNLTTCQVDAFANKAFEGNPAAVCFLASTLPELPDSVLQAIAAENNLSETAFVQPVSRAGNSPEKDEFKSCNRFKLRWFTPKIEVPLCGHATLASAAALFECAGNTFDTLLFETKSGELSVQRVAATEENESLKLAMSLPLLKPVEAEPYSKDFSQDSPLVAAALAGTVSGCSPAHAHIDNYAEILEVLYEPTLKYLVIVINNLMTQQQVENLKPDIKAMHAAHTEGKLVGVIITASGFVGIKPDAKHDFYSRFFGPWAGIDEDPVTGSAHSVLGPYWADDCDTKELKARQCSKRGGELGVSVDKERERVVVSGGAVVVIRGELMLNV